MEMCQTCPHPRSDHYVRKGDSVTGCMWCVCQAYAAEAPAPEFPAEEPTEEETEEEAQPRKRSR